MAPVTVRGPDRRTIWRRRVVLMAIVGLSIALPVTILAGGGGDAPPVEPLTEIKVKAPEVGPLKVEQSLGVKFRVPEGWTRKQKQDVLELRSKDGAARVAISAPGPAADAKQLHSEVIAGLRGSYREFDIAKNIDKAPLGGLKGKATVASGTPHKKSDAAQRILVTTAEGRKRAYLAVVFTSAETSPSVLEAQALVNNLRFTK